MNKRFAIFILFFLLIANLFAWSVVYEINQSHQFEVVFFDVGQGDAIFIKSPEGHRILIDGGSGPIILERLSEEMFFWERNMDLVILTHTHHDHVGGLIDVVSRYNIDFILWNGLLDDNSVSRAWKKTLENTSSNIKIAKAGRRIKGQSFYIDVLYPFKHQEVKDLNLSSLVLRMVSKNGTFIFMGDAYKINEREIIEKQDFCNQNNHYLCSFVILESDVLKVGHHGSRTSTSNEFLKRVNPSKAIISAGKNNSYGHPHKETLEILKNHGIRVFRTDLDGSIKITF